MSDNIPCIKCGFNESDHIENPDCECLHWTPPPTHDTQSDPARKAAEEHTCACDVPVTDARRRTHCHLCGCRKRKGKRLPIDDSTAALRREVEELRAEKAAQTVVEESGESLSQEVYRLRNELSERTRERDEALHRGNVVTSEAIILKQDIATALARAEALEKELAEAKKDTARLDWLEAEARKSRTGISLDYVNCVEDGQVLERGFRYMRQHRIDDPHKSVRAAIDAATATGGGEG